MTAGIPYYTGLAELHLSAATPGRTPTRGTRAIRLRNGGGE